MKIGDYIYHEEETLKILFLGNNVVTLVNEQDYSILNDNKISEKDIESRKFYFYLVPRKSALQKKYQEIRYTSIIEIDYEPMIISTNNPGDYNYEMLRKIKEGDEIVIHSGTMPTSIFVTRVIENDNMILVIDSKNIKEECFNEKFIFIRYAQDDEREILKEKGPSKLEISHLESAKRCS